MTFYQAISYAKNLLKRLMGSSDLSSGSERSRDADDISVEAGSSSTGSQHQDELFEIGRAHV